MARCECVAGLQPHNTAVHHNALFRSFLPDWSHMIMDRAALRAELLRKEEETQTLVSVLFLRVCCKMHDLEHRCATLYTLQGTSPEDTARTVDVMLSFMFDEEPYGGGGDSVNRVTMSRVLQLIQQAAAASPVKSETIVHRCETTTLSVPPSLNGKVGARPACFVALRRLPALDDADGGTTHGTCPSPALLCLARPLLCAMAKLRHFFEFGFFWHSVPVP